MSEKNTQSSKTDQAAPRAAGIALAQGARERQGRGQVDVGIYWIVQNGLTVGELYVEQDAAHPNDPCFMIEHWCLYSTFEAPSAQRPDTALTFRRVDTEYASAEAFRSQVRTIVDARYIQAACHEMAP